MKREKGERGEEEVKTVCIMFILLCFTCLLQKTISLMGAEVKHKDKNLSSSVV